MKTPPTWRRPAMWVVSGLFALMVAPVVEQNVQVFASQKHWDTLLVTSFPRMYAEVVILTHTWWFSLGLGIVGGAAGWAWTLELSSRFPKTGRQSLLREDTERPPGLITSASGSALTPDWKLEDIFSYVDPNHLDRSWNNTERDIKDKLSLGLITAWGKEIKYGDSRRLPMAEIPKEFWRACDFTYHFFRPEFSADSLDVFGNVPASAYANVHVNAAQTKAVFAATRRLSAPATSTTRTTSGAPIVPAYSAEWENTFASLQTLYSVDVEKRILSLRFHSDGEDRHADAVLLLLYGYRRIFGEDEVRASVIDREIITMLPAATLLQSLTGIGGPKRSATEIVREKLHYDVDHLGLATGGYFKLTNDGYVRASHMAGDLIARA